MTAQENSGRHERELKSLHAGADLLEQIRTLRRAELLHVPECFDDRILAIVQSILRNDLPGGRDSPSQRRDITPDGDSGFSILHPPKGSADPAVCSSAVGIYLAGDTRYDRRHFGTTRGIEALLEYYRSCTGIVRLGVVVTDCWSVRTLARYAHPLDYFEQRGIFTAWLIVNGGRVIPMIFPR